MKILLGILLGLVMVGIATSSADEIERICPIGSQLTTNSQGTSFCVDRSGNPTGFSNPGDTGNSGDTGIYLMSVGIVVIIIIAVIIKVSKKSEPETP